MIFERGRFHANIQNRITFWPPQKKRKTTKNDPIVFSLDGWVAKLIWIRFKHETRIRQLFCVTSIRTLLNCTYTFDIQIFLFLIFLHRLNKFSTSNVLGSLFNAKHTNCRTSLWASFFFDLLYF